MMGNALNLSAEGRAVSSTPQPFYQPMVGKLNFSQPPQPLKNETPRQQNSHRYRRSARNW